jgi:adenylate kinase family enzyme
VQRVLIIGSPGSGKSTLARHVAAITGLPLIHLDQHYWQSGWVETPDDQWRTQVADLAAADRWIIDGNYGGTLEARLDRADTVIDLELPAWLCVWRLLRRIFTGRGRVRPDMAPGCPERFSVEFLLYTAAFPGAARRRTNAKLNAFVGKRVHLTSRGQVQQFLASFELPG